MGFEEFKTNFFNGDGDAFVEDAAPGFAFFHTASDHATEDLEVIRRLIPVSRSALGPDFQWTHDMRGEVFSAVRWTATLDGLAVEGVDLVREAPDGRMAEVRITMRPLEGVVAFKQAMFDQFGLIDADVKPPD